MNAIALRSTDPASEPVTIDPKELEDIVGCDAILGRISRRSVFVHERWQVATTPEAAQRWTDEIAALHQSRALVKQLRQAISLCANEAYEKGFRAAVRRRLSPEAVAEIHAEARAYVDEMASRRRITAAAVGAAIGMRAGGGAPRVRTGGAS